MSKRNGGSKIIIISLTVIAIAAVALFLAYRIREGNREVFRFVSVERGDIKNTITSTGMIQPRSMIAVGTQISGTFEKIYVDFNDVVKEGQLMAELDKRMLFTSRLEAEAALLQAEERLNFSRSEYRIKKELYEEGYLSEIEFLNFRSKYFVDSSACLSAKAMLERAETNLGYADIVSPISGTVIERNVESGQTVAANFNTPILFVIAEDLSEMEIHAMVDESDISNVYAGQVVEFTVLTYPDTLFTGVIEEIRIQPRTLQNVVNYIVVINAENKYGLLLPGMTATVDFILSEKRDVLMVSQEALNFWPPRKMAEKYNRDMSKRTGSVPQLTAPRDTVPPSGSARMHRQGPDEAGTDEAGPDDRVMTGPDDVQAIQGVNQEHVTVPENAGQLWFLDENGGLMVEPVLTGASDEYHVEIVKHGRLFEGMQVISGVSEPEGRSRREGRVNPYQFFGETPQRGGGPPPPPQNLQ